MAMGTETQPKRHGSLDSRKKLKRKKKSGDLELATQKWSLEATESALDQGLSNLFANVREPPYEVP